MNDQQIHVELLDEGTLVWRPVSATWIKDKIFKIKGTIPEGETWAFQPGEIVECHERELLSSGLATKKIELVAFRAVPLEELDT
jgi:hypothetical protein